MFRDNLEEDRGMLFVFEEEKEWSFWMKNTFIPLDIIWLNREGKVVHIAKNVQPCFEEKCLSVNPLSPAKYVLEINGGIADEIDIAVGDSLVFDVD